MKENYTLATITKSKLFILSMLLVCITVIMSSCVGYQRVVEEERINGEMVITHRTSGYIVGTSGLSINNGRVNIAKNDTSDVAAGLVKDGIATGIAVVGSVSE